MTKAGYMFIYDVVKKTIWLRGLYGELNGNPIKMNMFYSSKSDIYLIKDQMYHERTKHINIIFHFIQDVIT